MPWSLWLLSLRFKLLLPEVLPSWNLHPLLRLCGGLRPSHLRLLGCSVLRAHGQLSRLFPQVRSAAHYRLWGCLIALIPDAFNTLGSRYFHLPTNCLSSWYSNDTAQPYVYSVSWRSCYNSCNTSAIPSLIVRKYTVHPCRAPHAGVRSEYSRRRPGFLKTP